MDEGTAIKRESGSDNVLLVTLVLGRQIVTKAQILCIHVL